MRKKGEGGMVWRGWAEGAYCQYHGIAEDFYKILMHESHISGAKEP